MSLVTGERVAPKRTQEELVQRGRIARQMLEDDVLQDAFADAEQTFLRQWLDSSSTELREAAWAKIHALTEVQRALHRIVADGEHAEMKFPRRE